MARHLSSPTDVERVVTAPHAAMLIESMRDIGYSLESALADIIDNSIAAGATIVRLYGTNHAGAPEVAILDDGRGMSRAELLDAMRPGSRSPLDTRDSTDLGRFGLGLKTASFSQCRCLTVVSRREGVTAAARWDLDTVASSNEWLLEIVNRPETIRWVDKLGPQGTLVLWQRLDRVADNGAPEEVHQHFVRRLDDARDHLELVFHRFLAGERGLNRVSVLLNERALEPFDPFHSSRSEASPVEKLSKGVTLQAFTLPHHSKVTTAEWERYAGRAGYARSQGFYVYRGKRLIIHGTWFGLARQLELTKLARVRIDLPNDVDDTWKIDVRKSSAQPPRQVRDRLRRLIEAIGAGSKRVYQGRGAKLVGPSKVPVWHRVQNKNEVRYQVNAEHPVLAELSRELAEGPRQRLFRAFEMIGAALPVDSLFADTASQPEAVAGAALSMESHREVLKTTFVHLRKSGLGFTEISDMLRVTEPFRSSWGETAKVLAMLETAEGATGDE